MIKTITSSLTVPRFAFVLLSAPWRGLPLKAWQAERVKPTAEKSAFNGKYQSLKEEIREVETIRRYVEGMDLTAFLTEKTHQKHTKSLHQDIDI